MSLMLPQATKVEQIYYSPTLFTEYQRLMENIFRRLGHRNFVIAGGAVRDMILSQEPKDVDVFILNLDGDFPYENFSDLTVPSIPVSFADVVASYVMLGRDVQFINSPHATITDLLQSFDWIECMYALDPDGQVWTTRDHRLRWGLGTSLHLNPNHTMIADPIKTLFRGVRFNDRLQLALQHEDILTLSQLICKEG